VRTNRSVLLFLAVLVLAALVVGCTSSADDSASEQSSTASEDGGESANDDSPDSDSSADESGGAEVLMMGRSVMGGWFQSWGWNWDGPVEREGYTLTYGELETPPEIASSACDHIAQAPEGSVVFFKFCFDDFWGDSGARGNRQVQELEGWVEEVAACAEDRGVVLVVGNALPKVAEYTDSALVLQHRNFNSWLDEFAEGNPNVYVVDVYGPLTDSDGALRSEYAVGATDSHLTPEAYEALDPLLFEVLAEASE
jgi:hypothetical protein